MGPRRYDFVSKSGAWIKVSPEIVEELASKKIEIPEKFQGKNGLFKYLEDNQEATNYFYNKFSNNIYRYEEKEILNDQELFFNNIMSKSFFDDKKLIKAVADRLVLNTLGEARKNN